MNYLIIVNDFFIYYNPSVKNRNLYIRQKHWQYIHSNVKIEMYEKEKGDDK